MEAAAARPRVILVRPFTEADDVAGFFAAQGILTSEGGKASHAALVARGMGKPASRAPSAIESTCDARRAAGRRHRAPRGRSHRDRRLHRPRDGRRRPARRPRGRRALRHGAGLGRRDPPPRRARQRRHARGRAARARVRRRGHRPVPDGAHVHGRRPAADHAGDDPGRPGRAAPRARRAAADAAADFEGLLEEMAGPAGDHPAARPAAARVPPRRDRPRGEIERARGRAPAGRAPPRAASRARARARGVQPDARHARRAPRHHAPGDLRDAGRGDRRARPARSRSAPAARRAGDHDPARRLRAASSRSCATASITWPPTTARRPTQLPRRHDDRAAAGLLRRRPPRRARRLLLVRHQRPHPDRARPLPRRRRGRFLPDYLEQRIIDRSPFETIDEPGVGWLVGWPPGAAATRGPTSSSASAASTAATPTPSRFFHRAGLDYVSCSPFRVPIARVAAAQAAAREAAG